MIESFILSVVLFVSASLCWGLVFSIDVMRLGKRPLIVSILISAILSIFAAVFFLKGFTDLGNDLDILVTSIVFALTFVFALAIGFIWIAPPRQDRSMCLSEN